MAQIIIERTAGSLADRFRPYKVMIDGQQRGSISQRERWSFEVTPGTHTVSFQVGYNQLPPVKVAVATRTRLLCRSSAAHAFGLIASSRRDRGFRCAREDDIETIETPYPGDLFGPSDAAPGAAGSARDGQWRSEPNAKTHGSLRLFGPKMDRTTQAKRMLELDLHDAITARKLEIRYRPQIDLVTRRITTFEALLHWDHPVHGKVPAAHFVPLAEELGLICAVGQEVLEEACREASLWADGVSVAVNITAGQLADAALPAIVASALRTSGLAASRLVLEVSQAMVNSGAATLVSLQALRETGVRIAIDDFGLDPSSLRSLSSLNSLAETPIDEIKVHRSLVSGLCESRDRLATVRATIGLCAKLGIPCCAVGVESKDDLEILQNEKCPQVQGHLFGSALEAREIAALLDQCNPFALGPAGARRSGPVPFARILELTSDCVMVTTADMLPPGPLIVYFNQAFAKLSGYSAEELLGRCPTVLQGPDAIRTAVDFIRAALQTGNPLQERVTNVSKGGVPYCLEMQIEPLQDESGTITHFAIVGHQIERDRRRIEIEPGDQRDALTGIATGQSLMRAVVAEIDSAKANAGDGRRVLGPCLMLADVDRFVHLTHDAGQAATDAVLCGLADRLGESIRRSDMLGRLGGGQFAVCMTSISMADAAALAQCLRRAVAAAPFDTPRGRLPVTISVGVAAFAPGDNLTSLLERAGNALSAERQAGRDRVKADFLAAHDTVVAA